MSGFCWRHHYPKREVFGKILDGALGDVHAMYSTYNGGEVWKKKREDGWSDLEAQLRNWNAHLWLSGDSIVEQAVHCIDMMQWAMGDQLPLHAEGSGGRQVYDDPDKYGNIYDHFACVYEWENGAKGYHFSRQQNGTVGSYEVELFGTKGTAPQKIVIQLLLAMILGDIAEKIMTCIKQSMMNYLPLFGQVNPLMTEKKLHTAQWLQY